jgi:hypothetical protein
MKNAILFIALYFLLPVSIRTQTIDFAAKVDLVYRNQQIIDVLEDLNYRYGISFSYSRNIIPLDQEININLPSVQFKQGLDSMLSQTQIIYGFIGDQLVLSLDHNKTIIPPDLASMGYLDDDNYLASIDELDTYRLLASPVETIPVRSVTEYKLESSLVAAPKQMHENLDQHLVTLPVYPAKSSTRESIPSGIQATFVPGVSWTSNEFYEDELAFSLNFIGANDASLNGFELGIIGNTLRQEMKGFQMAGIYNIVEEEITGTQFSGIGNYGGANARGLFAAGIFNSHRSIDGTQVSGVVNIVTDYSRGIQVAGIGNISQSESDLLQVAGVYNIGREKTGSQISGLFNVADEIHGVQISPLFNSARHVKGTQIGLFNFADSVDGASIGLITFVKKGYKSFEVAGEDIAHYNAMIRLGTRSFYNIFRAGVQRDWDSWSLGYGIGTSVRLRRNNYIQFELHASHVNENENWTNKLNLLSQFYMNLDLQLIKGVSITAGPTANLFISQLYHPEKGYGSQLPNYTLVDKTYYDSWNNKPLNLKFWIGFHVGFRFNSG